MSQQNQRARKVKLAASWRLMILACGVVFLGFGVAILVAGFDVASKLIGVVCAGLGSYLLILGARSGVVVDHRGIEVRAGMRSTKPVPWPSVSAVEVEETDFLFVRSMVPTLVAEEGDSGVIPLRSLTYYRVRSARTSRKVERLKSVIAEYRA